MAYKASTGPRESRRQGRDLNGKGRSLRREIPRRPTAKRLGILQTRRKMRAFRLGPTPGMEGED